MLIKAFGITDVGLKREGNEDAYLIHDELGLYIVADGMGGHLAGEVASRIAVEVISNCFQDWRDSETPEEFIFGPPDYSLTREGNYILGGIRLANRVIHELATEYESKYGGMGTTVTVLAATPQLVIAANVGDSRLYIIRNGQIEMLSKDHTVVAEQVEMGIMTSEEATVSPLKHVLTRNVGSAREVDAEVFEIVPADNDRYVLCTDGLTDLVNDNEILQMVEAEDNPEALCRDFINKALKRGAHDNTTVISVFISGHENGKSGAMKTAGVFLADILLKAKKIVKGLAP